MITDTLSPTIVSPNFSYPRHTAQIEDVEFRYWDEGEGSTILLIHGLAESVENWAWLYPSLIRNHRVIAVDLPGFGQSPVPPSSYLQAGLRGAAEVLYRLSSALNIENPLVIGHSLGAGIALEYAYTAPESIAGLVMISSMGFGTQIDIFSRLLTLPVFGELVFHPSPFTIRAFFPSLRPIEGLDTLIRLTHQYMSPSANKTWILGLLRQGVNLWGQSIRLDQRSYAHFKFPVQLIWGDRDPMFPTSHAQLAAQLLPNAQLTVLRDVYHHPNIERPETVLRLIEALLT